jgi:NAD(P)H-hydrate epimerase
MVLVTAEEMREMDRRTIESFGIPGRVLMENAGRGATEFLMELFPNIGRTRVGVLAGRGNNGGDGYVMARCLSQRGVGVTVFLLGESSRVSGDAAANLALLSPMGIPVFELPDASAFDAARDRLRRIDLWIDAILGTGLRSDVRGYLKEVINFVNSLKKPVFAVDIPSGLNSDTGRPCGACIRATATATFAFAKTGHYQHPGAHLCGELRVVDIGIPPHISAAVGPKQMLLSVQQAVSHLQSRPSDAHKGSSGHLLVIAGSTGKTGAAAMCALAAMRAGAGLVSLGIPGTLNPILESQVLEVMTEPLPEITAGALGTSALDKILSLLEGKRCLALGPGLGQAPETGELVRKLITTAEIPVVIDADGLNLLAGKTEILAQRTAPTVLTPHPGEMARLIGTAVKTVQADRITCARQLAMRLGIHVVLKGAATLTAHPDGHVFINPTGNPGMAAGGMGDVLTGLIAGFVTQGVGMEGSCHLGVYLHGAAADTLAHTMGPWGYLASEVMGAVPAELRKLMP